MKILMFPISDELGATQCLVKVAEELRALGDEVIFASQGKFTPFIISNGFKVYPVVELSRDIYISYVHNSNLGFHTEASIEYFINEELKLFNKIKPDLIVDIFRPTIYISCKIAHLPRVHIANSILTKYYHGKLSIPETHWLSNIPLHSYLDTWTPTFAGMFYKNWMKPYNKVLKRHNLLPVKHLFDLYEGTQTILMDAKEFATIRNAPNTFHQVGPLVHDITNELPSWYDKLKTNNELVIYVSMGSTGTLIPKIVNDLTVIFKDRKKVQIVANSTLIVPLDAFPQNSNVFIAEFLPAKAILEKSDVIITHGGRGTIYHALQNGVPIIGIPHQAEQEWNLNRVEELGLGIKLSKKKYCRKNLESAINKILSDPKYKINAMRLMERLRRYNGHKSSAKLIHYLYAKRNNN